MLTVYSTWLREGGCGFQRIREGICKGSIRGILKAPFSMLLERFYLSGLCAGSGLLDLSFRNLVKAKVYTISVRGSLSIL